MNDWLLFLFFLLSLPYLGIPILIRRNHNFCKSPQLRLISGFLPPAVEKYFDERTKELGLLGFESKIDAVSLDFIPHVRVFLRLFVSRKQSITALCTSLIPEGSEYPVKNFFELSSRFKNGYEVSTHNSDMLGAPIEPQKKLTAYFPGCNDIKALLFWHEKLVRNSGLRDQPALLPHEGQEQDFLASGFEKDLQAQASLGCLSYDHLSQSYRPTWAGAFLMGWYSMWPITLIRTTWHKIKLHVMLKKLRRLSA